eukprot:SAG31_NODE_176_length_21334_cov_12.211067_16_plen_120_part_00
MNRITHWLCTRGNVRFPREPSRHSARRHHEDIKNTDVPQVRADLSEFAIIIRYFNLLAGMCMRIDRDERGQKLRSDDRSVGRILHVLLVGASCSDAHSARDPMHITKFSTKLNLVRRTR